MLNVVVKGVCQIIVLARPLSLTFSGNIALTADNYPGSSTSLEQEHVKAGTYFCTSCMYYLTSMITFLLMHNAAICQSMYFHHV